MNCLALALIKLIIDFSPYTFQIHQQQHSRKTLRQKLTTISDLLNSNMVKVA